MRKRWTAIGLVGCLLVGMLAGCSGSGQQETTAGTGQETVQETASQGAAEDVLQRKALVKKLPLLCHIGEAKRMRKRIGKGQICMKVRIRELRLR